MTGRSVRGERGALRIDPRLIIGVILIAGSTLGGWALVTSLDDDAAVYVARETLTPGATIGADDLAVASVRLDGGVAAYLEPSEIPSDGLVVSRTIGAGELVAESAVDDTDRSGLTTVVVPSRGPLPTGLVAGSRVDVWTAARLEAGGFEPPVVLAGGVEVAGLLEREGMVESDNAAVEVLVPRSDVAALLQALAAGDAIDLVPARAGGE